MVGAVPREEWDELLELVVEVDPDAFEDIARLNFRAQNLVRRKPADGAAHVLCGLTAAWVGEREMAVARAATGYGLRLSLRGDIANLLGMLLAHVGKYEDASNVYGDLVSRLGVNFHDAAANAVSHGLISGDTDLIGKVLGDAPLRKMVADDHPSLMWAIQLLGDAGLLDHLKGHQDVVRSIIGESQCMVDLELDNEILTQGLVIVRHHVLGDRTFRAKKQRHIHDALWDYYEAQGVEPNLFVGRLQASLWPTRVRQVVAA